MLKPPTISEIVSEGRRLNLWGVFDEDLSGLIVSLELARMQRLFSKDQRQSQTRDLNFEADELHSMKFARMLGSSGAVVYAFSLHPSTTFTTSDLNLIGACRFYHPDAIW
jgi:hypothetical protein